MAATRLIPLHVNKGKTIAQCLKDRTDYSEDDTKTNGGEYISSFMCDPKSCDQEFLLTKRKYLQINGFDYKGNIIAYQIRQSFKPGEVTPEEANAVGYETAMRWTKGKHAFIVATHVDRHHIHNHIIYNSTNLECDRKWQNFFWSSNALQKVSDLTCIEHGLSTITPRPYGERVKYDNPLFRSSIRDEIRADIEDIFRENPKNFDEFITLLLAKEYEIKNGKVLSLRKKGYKQFARIDTLGYEYSEDNLRRRITGEEIATANHATIAKRDFDVVLDIQKIIAKNKGPNYERWAKRYNLKQTAKALCFIQEHGIKMMSELVELTDNATLHNDELREALRIRQSRLDEIVELKKHIIAFAKTRETFEAYRRSGYSKAFFEKHRDELLIRKVAKKYFENHNITKIPKVKDLNDEYGRILAEKKKLFAEYRESKTSMQDFLIARQNLETLLASEAREQEKSKEKNVIK